jgi:hypothetical protein
MERAKCWCLHTSLHGITSQNTEILNEKLLLPLLLQFNNWADGLFRLLWITLLPGLPRSLLPLGLPTYWCQSCLYILILPFVENTPSSLTVRLQASNIPDRIVQLAYAERYVTWSRLFAAGDGKCVKSYNAWKCFLEFSMQTMVSAATRIDVSRFAIGSYTRMRVCRITNSETFIIHELIEDIKKWC